MENDKKGEYVCVFYDFSTFQFTHSLAREFCRGGGGCRKRKSNADIVHAMINDHNDNYQTMPCGSNVPKWPQHALTCCTSQFCDTLYDWRTEMATGLFGALDFWPADLLLHEEIVKDIAIFVDANKIVTPQDLWKKTNWILCNQYSNQIISLIQCFFPPVPLPNLFVLMPLPL